MVNTHDKRQTVWRNGEQELTVNKTQCLVIDNSEPKATEDSSIRLLNAVGQSHIDTRLTHNTTKAKHTQNDEEITRTHNNKEQLDTLEIPRGI